MRLNTVPLSLLTSCIQHQFKVYFAGSTDADMGAFTLSDGSGEAGNRNRINWAQTIGIGLTIVTMSIAGLQYINSVNAKADTALQQISELKAYQRQSAIDSRDDLRTLNNKVDQVLLRLGPSNGR